MFARKKGLRLYAARILAVTLLCLCATPLLSYTWYLEGSREYWYTLKKGEGSPWSNEQNSQKKWGMLNGQAVIMNGVKFKTYDHKAPFPLKGVETAVLMEPLSILEANDKEFLKNLVDTIAGDAGTLDEAVDRIGKWVKNTIKYHGSSPSDPIAAIKAKSARSAGFGNIFAELLLAAGIPSRTMSCYIPKGYGSGFKSDGGYYSLVEYYYPGRGWFSSDPLGSLHFTDPYHVVEWGYGAVNFAAEIASIDESYAVDVKLEPKGSPAFFVPAWEKPKRPAFVFRVVDREGKTGLGIPGLRYGAVKAMELLKKAVPGGGATLLGGDGSDNDVSDPSGLSARFGDGSFVAVRTSPGATHVSVIALDGTINALRFKDTAFVSLGQCLYVNRYHYKGPDVYRFNADFSDESKVKRILLRDGWGEALKNKEVTVAVCGEKFGVSSDSRGAIYLITDEKACEVAMDGTTHTAAFDYQGITRIPREAPGDDAVEKYLLSHGIKEGPALVCELLDLADVPCKDAFDTVLLYSDKQKPRALEVKTPGIVTAGGLVPGENYYLLLSDGIRHIKRKFMVRDKEMVKMAISAAREPFALFKSGEPPAMPLAAFYEFLGSGAVLALKAVKGEMLASFPPGDYVFSSAKDGEKCRSLQVTPGAKTLLYDPADITPDDFIKTAGILARGRNYTAGCIVHSGERIRSADIWLGDMESGSMIKSRISGEGFFQFHGLKEGNRYRVLYYNERFLVSGQFSALQGKNVMMLDTSKMAMRTVLTGGGAKKHGYGPGYGEYNQKNGFKILFPCWIGRLKLVSQNFSVKDSSYRLYLDSGGLLVSTSGGIEDAVSISAGWGRTEYDLSTPAGDPLVSRFNALKDIVPKNTPVLIMRLTGPLGNTLGGVQARLISVSDSRYVESDAKGIVWAENLKMGEEYRLVLDGKGYRLEYPLLLPGGGLRKLDIDMKKLPQILMTVKNYDGTLFRSYVERKGDRIVFNNESLTPQGESFSVYTPEGSAFFRMGKAGILKELTAGIHTVDLKNVAHIPIDEYGKIASTLFKDTAVMAFSLAMNGIPMKEFSLKVVTGDEMSTIRSADGVAFVTGKNGATSISYSGKGYYYECVFAVKEGAACLKKIDLVKDADLYIELAGAAGPGRQISIYKDEPMNNAAFIKATADDKGICRISMPDGTYHVDYGNGEPVKVQLQGKQLRMKLPL